LPPVQCGFQLSTGLARAPVQIELFHDLVCPFSCKMFKTVFHEVIPKCSGHVQFVLQPVPQPWHPQGTYVHEAALAVKQVAPAAYPAYVDAVFTAYSGGSFKDDTTWDKSRAQIYDELLALLSSGPPELATVDAAAVKELLTLKAGVGNVGTEMTQHIKWAVKYHRCRGVHVTPTVHVNGLEAGVVSSGWTAAQWLKFLEQDGADNFQAAGV